LIKQFKFNQMSDIITVPTTSGTEGFLGGGSLGALLIGALLFGGGMGGFGGNRWGGMNGSPAASAVATDVVLNPAFQSLQNQITNLSSSINSNALMAGLDGVNANIQNTVGQLGQGIAAVNNNVTQTNFNNLNSINGLGRDITAANTQALINQIQNFNSVNGNLTNSTNQIISQGAALSTQLLACCCETQKSIAADGNMTRALINQLDKENLLSQLADSKSQVNNLNQTASLTALMAAQTNTILTHLIPNRSCDRDRLIV
jgi:hypothetical protein